MISFKSVSKDRWDKFILILAIQNSFIIPIDLAFGPEFTKGFKFKVFDGIVDILFLVDMILMFMTSYQDSRGKEIKDSHTIAANYMK